MYFIILLINRAYRLVKKRAEYFSASLQGWSSWVELPRSCCCSAFEAQEPGWMAQGFLQALLPGGISSSSFNQAVKTLPASEWRGACCLSLPGRGGMWG